jgi:hypothetical protein
MPVEKVPIDVVQTYLGDSIKRLQEMGTNGQMLQTALSMLEYLKDAKRWHYAEGHPLPDLSGKELREFVDAEIESNRIDV